MKCKGCQEYKKITDDDAAKMKYYELNPTAPRDWCKHYGAPIYYSAAHEACDYYAKTFKCKQCPKYRKITDDEAQRMLQ